MRISLVTCMEEFREKFEVYEFDESRARGEFKPIPEQRLNKIEYYLRCLLHVIVNKTEFWEDVLNLIYEGTSEITKVAFDLSVDVAPNSSFEYEISLEGTPYVCICPTRTQYASIAGDSRLTVLVNEYPLDITEIPSEWMNKYVALNEPIPTEPTTKRIEILLKRKVKVILTNQNPDTTSKISFYMPCMLMDYRKAKDIIEGCHIPLIKDITRLIFRR